MKKTGIIELVSRYEGDPEREDWLRIMRHIIALNASQFNTQRMVEEYVLKAYLL